MDFLQRLPQDLPQISAAREPLQQNLSLPGKHPRHVCSRFCQLHNVLGDVWQCESSGAVHLCTEDRCRERTFFDNHNCICKLTKQLIQTRNCLPGRCVLSLCAAVPVSAVCTVFVRDLLAAC